MRKLIPLLILLLAVNVAYAADLNVQGRLRNSTGSVLNGDYTFTFALYEAYSGSSSIYENVQSLTVKNGVYNAILKNINTTFNTSVYLGVKVGSDSEMPRINLTSSPYAYRANISDNLEVSRDYSVRNLTAKRLESDIWDNVTITESQVSDLRSQIKINQSVFSNSTGNITINWNWWNITEWHAVWQAYQANSSRWNNITDNGGADTDTRHQINQSVFLNDTGNLTIRWTWWDSNIYFQTHLLEILSGNISQTYTDFNTNISTANTSMKTYVDAQDDAIRANVSDLSDTKHPLNFTEFDNATSLTFNRSKDQAFSIWVENATYSLTSGESDNATYALTSGESDNATYALAAGNASWLNNANITEWDYVANAYRENSSTWNDASGTDTDTRHQINQSVFLNDTGNLTINWDWWNITEWHAVWQAYQANSSRWNNISDNGGIDTKHPINFTEFDNETSLTFNRSKDQAFAIWVENATYATEAANVSYALTSGEAVNATYALTSGESDNATYALAAGNASWLNNANITEWDYVANAYRENSSTWNDASGVDTDTRNQLNLTVFYNDTGEVGINWSWWNITEWGAVWQAYQENSSRWNNVSDNTGGSGDGNALAPINHTEFDNTSVLTFNRSKDQAFAIWVENSSYATEAANVSYALTAGESDNATYSLTTGEAVNATYALTSGESDNATYALAAGNASWLNNANISEWDQVWQAYNENISRWNNASDNGFDSRSDVDAVRVNISDNNASVKTYVDGHVDNLQDNIDNNISQTYTDFNSNITTANDSMKVYVDSNYVSVTDTDGIRTNTTDLYADADLMRTNISDNNASMKTYIDSQISTTYSELNANITTANDSMKVYVDEQISGVSDTDTRNQLNLTVFYNDTGEVGINWSWWPTKFYKIPDLLEILGGNISQTYSDFNANISTANSSMKTYVDSHVDNLQDNIDNNLSQAYTDFNSNISTANSSMKTYVDSNYVSITDTDGIRVNTTDLYADADLMRTNISDNNDSVKTYVDGKLDTTYTDFNSNISTANDSMKVYVDAVATDTKHPINFTEFDNETSLTFNRSKDQAFSIWVENATYATEAANVSYALTSGEATNATYALTSGESDNATYALAAGESDNATYALAAGNASWLNNANITEWDYVANAYRENSSTWNDAGGVDTDTRNQLNLTVFYNDTGEVGINWSWWPTKFYKIPDLLEILGGNISQTYSDFNSNISTANSSMKTYVDGQITGFDTKITNNISEVRTNIDNNASQVQGDLNANISTANSSMKTYVDGHVDNLQDNIDNNISQTYTDFNSNISTANSSMKVYVDDQISSVSDTKHPINFTEFDNESSLTFNRSKDQAFAIWVENATYATEAANVSYALTSGESDNATYALSAGEATNASNATYALTSGEATNATYALTSGESDNATYALAAGEATNASNASYATSAGNASWLNDANITEWDYVANAYRENSSTWNDAGGVDTDTRHLLNQSVFLNDTGNVTINWDWWNITGWDYVLNAWRINVSIWHNQTTPSNSTYSLTSGIATNATYCLVAGNGTYALTSGEAVNATYALGAGEATNASNASYALTAGIATNATYALTAGESDNATYSLTSGESVNTTYALGAGEATNASNSSYALTSGIAADLVATASVVGDTEVDNDITIASTKAMNTTGDFNVNQVFNVSSTDGNVSIRGNITVGGIGYIQTNTTHWILD